MEPVNNRAEEPPGSMGPIIFYPEALIFRNVDTLRTHDSSSPQRREVRRGDRKLFPLPYPPPLGEGTEQMDLAGDWFQSAFLLYFK
jgi:hypothetical protein